MAASYRYHPEAEAEYEEAVGYYLRQAPRTVAEGFAAAVKSAVAALIETPERWRVFDPPDARRCAVKRYPYVLCYRWEPENDRVIIYAVMHGKREPGYWRHRLDPLMDAPL